MKKKNKIYIILLGVIVLLIVSIPLCLPFITGTLSHCIRITSMPRNGMAMWIARISRKYETIASDEGIARTIIFWWISPFHRARSGSSSTICSMESVC